MTPASPTREPGSPQIKPNRGIVVSTPGATVGVLSFHDRHGRLCQRLTPEGRRPVPSDLDGEEAWQYEERFFGYDDVIDGRSTACRRAVESFRRIEEDLPDGTISEVWAAVRDVYPELQDWVARRGHGGAAHFSRAAVEEGVADLRSNGADVVVVQLHAGFQFSEAPSSFVRQAAKASIDAGSGSGRRASSSRGPGFRDLSREDDRLQPGQLRIRPELHVDFPNDVPESHLRRDRMLEARVYPVLLDDYRPLPAAGAGAETIVKLIDSRGRGGHAALRVDGAVCGGRNLPRSGWRRWCGPGDGSGVCTPSFRR